MPWRQERNLASAAAVEEARPLNARDR